MLPRRSFVSLSSLALLAACGRPQPQRQGQEAPDPATRKRVAMASTTMVADLVRRVAGDAVDVVGLMGPGVDPHLYKANVSDIANLGRASIIFYNGLFLEGRLTEIFEAMAAKGIPVVAVGEAVPEAERLVPKGAAHPDPHVWGDVRNWVRAIDPVVEGLSRVEPKARDTFTRNAEALRAEWTALHEWARARCAEIPEGRRLLVTSHDAFGYFGNAYGLEVVGIQGISTAGEAGLADITRMADLVKERKVPAIFVETSVPHATIERVATDAGVKVGGELYSDACGLPGRMETVNGQTYDLGTYAGMIRHNVNTLVDALK